MAGKRLKYQLSTLVYLAISLASLRRARALPLGPQNKFLWISAIAMAFMLRQVLQSPSPKLVTDHSKVGRKINDGKGVDFDEYDFVIIGGGTCLALRSGQAHRN